MKPDVACAVLLCFSVILQIINVLCHNYFIVINEVGNSLNGIKNFNGIITFFLK